MKIVSRSFRRNSRIRKSGIPPAESLESRVLLSAAVSQVIPPVSFPQDSPAVTIDLSQFFTDNTAFFPQLTYGASVGPLIASNVPIMTASINGSNLTLNFTPGQSGYDILQISATDPSGGKVTQNVRVKVTAAADRSKDIKLGGSGPHSLIYVPVPGIRDKIDFFGPGTAVVHVGGDALDDSGGMVRGTRLVVESIAITGSSPATSLTLTGHGRTRPIVGDITSDGPMRSIRLAVTDLVGDVTAAKDVPQVTIEAAQNGTVAIGAGSKPVAAFFTSVADENFASAASVRGLTVGNWVNTDNVDETFSAPSIKRLLALGNFMPGLQLSGAGVRGTALGPNFIAGSIGGPWHVTGGSNPLRIGSAAPSFNGTFDRLPALRVTGAFGGVLNVPSIKSVVIGGLMSGGGLNLTAGGSTMDLGQLKVRGGIVSCVIQANGNIGSISAETLDHTLIAAGISTLPQGETFPQSAGDFASSQSIGAVMLHPRGRIVGFATSDLWAMHLGTLSFGTIRTANGGVPFGLAASRIGSLVARDVSKNQTFNLINLHDPAGLAAQIQAKGLSLGDFTIKLL